MNYKAANGRKYRYLYGCGAPHGEDMGIYNGVSNHSDIAIKPRLSLGKIIWFEDLSTSANLSKNHHILTARSSVSSPVAILTCPLGCFCVSFCVNNRQTSHISSNKFLNLIFSRLALQLSFPIH